jgi:tRNA(Ile)-lysidine synthase
MVLARRRRSPPATGFSYILTVPGEVEVRELGLVLRLRPAAPAAWMYRGAPDRAGLSLDLAAGDRVTVRSRRPGDRLRPLGAAGSRRLKQVLIDRRVPRSRRDRLPLLVVGTEVAWVPGVTVAEACRLPREPSTGATVWVAELVEP